jgi:hypothetical protein
LYFTVFAPDRRGGGNSPTYGAFHCLRSEVTDLEALLDTGAAYAAGSAAAQLVSEAARSPQRGWRTSFGYSAGEERARGERAVNHPKPAPVESRWKTPPFPARCDWPPNALPKRTKLVTIVILDPFE